MPAVRLVATDDFGGHETAANVVGTAVVALDHHPDRAAPPRGLEAFPVAVG